MPAINNILIGRDQTKIFRIFKGNVEEITSSQSSECSGSALQVLANNALKESCSGGFAKEFTETCAAFPGAIIHEVLGSSVWAQPQPITYAINKNNVTLVVGSIGKSEGGGDTGPEPPADPNFGGEDPVPDPDAPGPPPAPPPLPTGNGNNGFTAGGTAGAQTGISGGNT